MDLFAVVRDFWRLAMTYLSIFFFYWKWNLLQTDQNRKLHISAAGCWLRFCSHLTDWEMIYKRNRRKYLSSCRPLPAPQCYLCTAVPCHSSMDPSRWCTRWRGALVPERVPGHRWTGPRRRRRTAGRRWWSFRSGGKARSSGLARKLEEEMEVTESSAHKLTREMCLMQLFQQNVLYLSLCDGFP